MLGKITKKVFGSRNDRLIRNYQKIVTRINALEPEMQGLSDTQLQAKPMSFENAAMMARTWTIYCPSVLLWCARLASVYWV